MQRYARQLVIPEIGLDGQIKLNNSAALIIGCGGLGSSCALYLAAAGVGRIGLVDHDTISLSNLARQVAYSTEEIGTAKVTALKRRLTAINPNISVEAFETSFTYENAEQFAEPYQVLIDGTDNLPARFLINDLCVLTRKPFVHGAVQHFYGQVGVFDASRGACYRCIYEAYSGPEMDRSKPQEGIVGPVAGVIGLIQAMEVIKLILAIGSPLVSQMLLYDALKSEINRIDLKKNPECKVCGQKTEITHLNDTEV
jgi:sulfur-carrier protein adenylyltransferase/sulfurtransferase